MGFSVKKALKKVIGSSATNAVTKVVNTKNLAYVAPYTSLATSGGRAALQKAYGPALQLAAGAVGGGGAAGAAAGIFAETTNANGGTMEPLVENPAENSAQVYSEESSGGSASAGRFAGLSGGDRTPLYIVAGIVAVGLLILPRLIRK